MDILYKIIILMRIFINISALVIIFFNFRNYVVNGWDTVINCLNNLEYFLFIDIDS